MSGLYGPSYTTELQLNPTSAQVSRLEERLRDFNRSQVGDTYRSSFLITLLDSENEVAGGVFAKISYGWLFIDTLWVTEKTRGSGHGRTLLSRAEAEARRQGCGNAWVDTFSFQARGFYEKNGYTVFGELRDFPPGHTRYFLRKALG